MTDLPTIYNMAAEILDRYGLLSDVHELKVHVQLSNRLQGLYYTIIYDDIEVAAYNPMTVMSQLKAHCAYSSQQTINR